MDEYVEESCNQCEAELVQVGGDWVCPNCEDLDGFTLDGKDYDFAL